MWSPCVLTPPPDCLQDPGTRLQFFKLLLCAEGSWTPGNKERWALAADPGASAAGTDWPKWRNMVVR